MTAASTRPPSDDQDVWVHSSFGLGYLHCRITPESLTETQPFVSPLQTAVCIDGRLDNRDELTSLFPSRAGESERLRSDAELIAAAYEEIGPDAISRLNGDFAVALCDSRREQLVLARDVMAAQPLYYSVVPGAVLFASEIKCLLADPRVTAQPDEDGLAALVLDDWCDPHLTCFKGIYSVPPGHLFMATRHRNLLREHWAFDPSREIRYRSADEYGECFRSLFEQSVRRRLRSAHPVAVSLSGGLDSSAIFCQAATLIRRESAPVALRGVAMTFPAGSPADERAFLNEIETAYGVQIARLAASEMRLAVDADATARHLEMPGVLWQSEHDVLEQARRMGCRVILNGFFGDQMLFERAYLVDLARQGRWLKVRHDIGAFADWMTDAEPGFFWREIRGRLVREVPPRWLFPLVKRRTARWRTRTQYPPWFAKAFRERAAARRSARLIAPGSLASSHAEHYYRHATAGHYVSIVRRQRAAGSMHGIEVWHPFRDRDLVAFLMAIPGEVVNRDGVPKGLLRQALSGILPEAIARRRWKADFTGAFNHGARRDYAGIVQLLSRDSLSVRSGLVDGDVLERSRGAWAEALTSDGSALAGWQLSDLAGLELWLRHYFPSGLAVQ